MSFRGGYYPEILDAIIHEADHSTRLNLRAVSLHLWKQVDVALTEHLVWRDDVMYSWNDGSEGPHPSIGFRISGMIHGSDQLEFASVLSKHLPTDHKTLACPRVVDIQSPTGSDHHWQMPETLAMLRLWPTIFKSGEASVNIVGVDTVVFCCEGDENEPVNLPSHSIPFQCFAALPLWEYQKYRLPPRVVIHLLERVMAAFPVAYFDGLTMADTELVMVAGSCSSWSHLRQLLEDVLQSDYERSMFRTYTLVNPSAQLQSDVLHRDRFGSFKWRINANMRTFGDLFRSIVKNTPLEARFRYVSLEEWANELGEERFQLEMGL